MEARRAESNANAQAATVEDRRDEIFNDPDAPVGGSPEGDVALVEFFDYNCPYCKKAMPVMDEAEAGDKKLKIIYKEFPILGRGSTFAAKAALAAHKRQSYLVFHKAMTEHPGRITEQATLEVAAQAGLDMARLKSDIDRPEIAQAIDRNTALAQILGITGTPGFVFGKEVVGGSIDIEAMRGYIATAPGKRARRPVPPHRLHSHRNR